MAISGSSKAPEIKSPRSLHSDKKERPEAPAAGLSHNLFT